MVSASNTSQVGNKYWNVWIDYNQDGDFTDAGEQVMNLNSTSTGTLSSNITIPLNAILGNTRMRVAMKYGAASTSCESFTYGEVEDYTVSIADPNGAGARKKSSDTDQLSDPEQLTEEIASNTAAKVYPNPVADHLHITVSDKYKNGGLFITDALGRIVYKENYLDQKEWDLVTADWASGIYLITLQNGRLMTYQRFIKE